nr:hypothetical protein [Tanacetum cinerariifolium]
MTTLADKAILSGADNHPPMLKKDMYDSWKRIMELYMMNRQYGQTILESAQNGPLIWPSIEENGYESPYQSQQYSNNPSSIPLSITYSSNDSQPLVYHNVYSPPQSIPQLEYPLAVNLDSGLTVLVFKQGDDPIDAINHMMSFLQQATINDKRLALRAVQGRQNFFATGTTRTYTPGVSRSNSRKQRTVICYNYKGEGHMSKQCTKTKRKRDDSWFKDKVLLVQAQANDQILHEEELAFLADQGIAEGQATQIVITYSATYQANDLDAYESNCDEINTTKVPLIENLSHFGSDVLIEAAVQNSNSFAQQDTLISSVIEQLKTQVINCTKTNLDNKSVNDTLTTKLERYKEQVKVLKEGQNVDLKSQDNVSNSCEQSVKVDRLKQTLSEQLKEKESLMQIVTLLKNDFKKNNLETLIEKLL